MKKILIAMTMMMTATGVNAFEFNTTGTNGDILKAMIVQQVIQ